MNFRQQAVSLFRTATGFANESHLPGQFAAGRDMEKLHVTIFSGCIQVFIGQQFIFYILLGNGHLKKIHRVVFMVSLAQITLEHDRIPLCVEF